MGGWQPGAPWSPHLGRAAEIIMRKQANRSESCEKHCFEAHDDPEDFKVD
jgi:hypothetical protein